MFRSPVLLTRVALASLIANALIVVTGGAVRLTGSGLGCDTWPQCTDGSYTPTRELGVHGLIEFGNRTLIGVVGPLAIAALVLALLHKRRALTVPATLVVAGVGAQGLLGGLTVHTTLNPWVVASHFLLSIVAIVPAFALWFRTRHPERVAAWIVAGPLRGLVWALCVTSAAVLVLGTVVTGSGPHAGDAKAARTGFDPEAMAQLHTDAVFLLLGLTLALWLALKATGAPGRAVGVLLVVELAQGVIGFVQYFTHLPVVLVGAHMAGACAVWIATLAVWHDLRTPGAAIPAVD
ncbi:COX15/CtaA family protein [Longispora sp. NPDC051575]|uniref:COX15/CtaA family protein n=1 Tax=Longispora sp. NPDC051575 TaxID=3154943 RepID=UPI003412336C